jgi:hypothetical protein
MRIFSMGFCGAKPREMETAGLHAGHPCGFSPFGVCAERKLQHWKQPTSCRHILSFLGLGFLLRKNPRKWSQPASMPAIHADFCLSEFALRVNSSIGYSRPPAGHSVIFGHGVFAAQKPREMETAGIHADAAGIVIPNGVTQPRRGTE